LTLTGQPNTRKTPLRHPLRRIPESTWMIIAVRVLRCSWHAMCSSADARLEMQLRLSVVTEHERPHSGTQRMMMMKMLMATVFALCMSACALDPEGEQLEQQAVDEDLVSPSPDYLESAKAQAAKAHAASVGPVVSEFASCGTAGPNIGNEFNADAPFGDAANQRSGSSTSCARLGVLQPTDDATYFCYTFGTDGYTWTYLRNERTGVRGWVRDDLLDGYGSHYKCGF
jgi:hypothetical protein